MAAHTIDDSTDGPNTYWGGLLLNLYSSHSDVLGADSFWGVDGIDVTTNGTSMTVTIVGPFLANGRRDYFGDLYISPTGWNVWNKTGDLPGYHNYPNDTFIADPNDPNYEGWKYVVTAGYGVTAPGVYVIDPNSIQWTDSQYRGSQGFRGGYGAFIEDATVIVPNWNTDHMSFTFDDTFLGNLLSLGFHWAEQCGNDVVEGQIGTSTSVPEPASMLLLGFGFAGLGLYRRRAR